MLTFMFWNLKAERADVLANLVRDYKLDVLILAECPMLPATILEALNRPAADYYFTPIGCPKLQLYMRFGEEHAPSLKEGNDFTIRRIILPGRREFLLCAVHLPSKLWQKDSDQTGYMVQFAHVLAEAEKLATHNRTLLVGDLNMNPYEDGVVTATGLHGVMTRKIASRKTRTVNKFESNLMFYNPMWSHFGERKEGHAGTYYYARPKERADYWNIYDQVLVRPDLLPYFLDEDVKILWRDLRGFSLLERDGRPDDTVSDHLPVLFRLLI